VGESDVPGVRSVGSGDRVAIVDVMTRAFHDDPGAMIIEPDVALRDDTMRTFFHLFMTAAMTEATLVQAIGVLEASAVGCWRPGTT
jgi:hypothetical protein